MSAELLEERDIALRLHDVLSEIDGAAWRAESAARLTPKLHELRASLEQKPDHAALAQTLGNAIPSLDDRSSTWLAFKQKMQPHYINLAKRLRDASIHVPSVRPTNYARTLMHLVSAVVAVVVVEFSPSPVVALAIAAAWASLVWFFEITRRLDPRVNVSLMKFFGKVAHVHEAQRVNSATWYATALVILALTQSKILCITGIAALGIGDPTAATIGRRWGRIKLFHGRSLEGTVAFFLSATVAAWALLVCFHPTVGFGVSLVMAASSGLVGATAELFSVRVDDNFSIPLCSGAAVGAVALVWGLPI
jgi:dolichol kinase